MFMHEMEKAIREAETIQRRADSASNACARVIKGRLRHVDIWVLVELKKELKSFNAVTHEWKP